MTSAKQYCMSKECKGCLCFTCALQNTDKCCGSCWDCNNQSEKDNHKECYDYIKEM